MSVGLLVCLPHHGQANIIRGEKTNPGAVLESNEELGHCLQIKVGEEGYDVVDEIESEDFRLQGAQGVCAILTFNKYTYFWQFAYLSFLSM